MPSARTPGRWPYKAGKPARTRRVIRVKDEAAPRGVARKVEAEPWRPTPLQSRLALAGLLVSCLFAAAFWAYRSPYLTVDHVTVRGTQQIPPEQITRAAGLDGDSAIGLDIDGARERVAALPKVRSVTVQRHGWSGVEITVEERVPWGSWQINGVNVPIDIDGHVLDGVAAPEGSPVIVEVEPQRSINPGDVLDAGAIQLAARLLKESDKTLGRPVAALVYRQSSGLTAVLGPPEVEGKAIWVTFGDVRDYEYKIATLYVLLQQVRDKDLALNAVDLRFGDRVSFN